MLRVSIGVCVLVLLVGCSDDEKSEPDAEMPTPTADGTALVKGLASLYAGDHPSRSDVEAGACFGEELLERAGYDRLVDAGIVDSSGRVVTELPQFDEETARLWVDAQFACVDFVEESTQALSAQTKGKLDGAAYAGCLRDALSDSEIRDAVVATLVGSFDAAEVQALSDAQVSCRDEAT